jgi:small subunit ribosomal protein S6
LKPYEAILILNSSLTEENVDSAVAKFEKKIKDNGGIDIAVTKWGNKKFATRFASAKKASEGHYVLIRFNGEGKTPNELRDFLNVSEEVLRYSVIASTDTEKEVKEEKVEIEPSMIAQSAEAGK